MAAHLGAMAIFKEPNPPSPSIATDDFVEFEDLMMAQPPLSCEDVPNLPVFDAGTEAKLRRKRAEREKWLDEAYTNFVQGGLDADCDRADLNTSSTSSFETSMTLLIDPPPPSPASSHAMSPRPQIEVQKLMKSLRALKLVETPPPESESKKRGGGEEEDQLALQAKKASGAKSLIQMLHFVHDGEVGDGTMQDATDAEAELQLWKR